MKYPNRPGYKKLGTSFEAAEKITAKSKTLQAKCLELLRLQSLTADEVAACLKESILSIRPRISELAKLGLIKETGDRRMNESGNRAAVWKAIRQGSAKQEDLFKRAA